MPAGLEASEQTEAAPRRRRPIQAREAPEAVVVEAPDDAESRVAAPRRRRPIQAREAPEAVVVEAPDDADSRFADLRSAVAGLRTRAGSIDFERAMLTAGAVLLPLGLLAIAVGWYGASRTPYEFEQIPYLMSGGLLGLGFVVVGGFLYFGYWLTRLLNEQRTQGQRLVDALERIEERLEAPASNGAAAPGTGRRFVATPSGSMFHDPTCPVVQGKSGLRRVSGRERDMVPCRICDPLGD